MSEENLCALCRHCTYEYKPYNEFVCHNEESSRYGEILNGKARNKECADFSAHKYSNEEMTLKDALLLVTSGSKDFCGVYYNAKLPDKDNKTANLMYSFKTNEAMAEYTDAIDRLFSEYMRLAEADGDFKK